jgi:hypothetical protein
MFLGLNLLKVALKVLAASELFQHHHLILSLIWCLLKQACLLLLLCQIDDVGPSLLILSLEVFEELIEALIPFSHALDRLIQGLAWLALVLLNEGLQLLNLLYRAGTHYRLLFLRVWVRKEEHLRFLVLVLGRIHNDIVSSECLLRHSQHVQCLVLTCRHHKLHSREVLEHIY